MATLGILFGGPWLAMRGRAKKTAEGPPINASSKDEEAFIQYALLLGVSSDELLTLFQRVFKKRGG
jgi:ATP synthase subunit K